MEDLSKYKDIFLSEAKEHIEAMNSSLLKLEKNPQDLDLVSQILREIHTLKSMAATMNYDKTTRLCHTMEDVLDAIKKKKIKPQSYVDILFECFDTLELNLKEVAKDKEELDVSLLVQKLQTLHRRPSPVARESNNEPRDTSYEIRDTIHEIGDTQIEKTQNIEVKVERLDLLMNLVEELLVTQMRLDRIRESLENPELSTAVNTLGKLIADLQYNVIQARMVAIGFIFNRFPRMIRDLAKQQKKEVNLEMEGSDIELDRAVIDQVGEPLVHLLRNAVDHAIEAPEERKRANKSPQGTIKLTAKRVKNFALIEVEDDGKGIAWEEIKNMAIKKGILSQRATKEEVMDSLFLGLSTTKQVSAVSGRGLGLNIVKKKVESLGGIVKVESKLQEGTKFTLELPLTLAIINTLFVTVGGKTYAIPLANIERLVTVKKEDIKEMLNYEAIVLNGEDIPITRLNVLFNAPLLSLERQPIVIIRKGEEKLGLTVDAFVGTQEIVIKPLNKLVRENKYFAGCSIVGSGEVVLVLDMSNLMLTKRQYTVSRES